MGSADVVPGVSGGTIAFITGIYEELVNSIRSVNGEAFKLLFQFKIKAFWQHVNLTFLIVLIAGIAVAFLSFARLLTYLLENHRVLLWGFFFGLIVASALIVSKQIKNWNFGVVLTGVFGIGIAYLITVVSPAETPETWWFIFLSGMIAICAMILPGISGSFIMLLLGKYAFMMRAVKNFDIVPVLFFMMGAVVGIISFSHVIHYMLKKYPNATIALLTGFMLGSLNKVYPWKHTLKTYTDRHGEIKPLIEENVLPTSFESLTGQEPQILAVIALAVTGFLLVYLIEIFANKMTKPQA